RPGGRAGRTDHLDGAHGTEATVPLLPATPPLRAELPRPPPARTLRRRSPHGLRRLAARADHGGYRRGNRPPSRLPRRGDRRCRQRGPAHRRAALAADRLARPQHLIQARPSLPFLRRGSRDELREATGATKLPALKLRDGTVITHSRAILS